MTTSPAGRRVPAPARPGADDPPPHRSGTTARPWIALVVRLALAGIALWAGIAKITDLEGSVRAVRAYDLMPGAMADVVGYALPAVEIIVGLLLLVGLLTRYAALANGLLMLAFAIGVASAWARGLSIDCGCFGGGGEVEEGAQSNYLVVIVRDVLIVLASAFLVRWPRSRYSLDGALGLDP